jgi:hypothetical protein
MLERHIRKSIVRNNGKNRRSLRVSVWYCEGNKKGNDSLVIAGGGLALALAGVLM